MIFIFVGDSYGASAWILWLHTQHVIGEVEKGRRSRCQIESGHQNYEACMKARDNATQWMLGVWSRAFASHKDVPGEVSVTDSRVVVTTPTALVIFQYHCLPDTIDPRN